MAVNLLVGPPSSGKTLACIQKIRALQNDQPLQKIWLIVPDRQKNFYYPRRIAHGFG